MTDWFDELYKMRKEWVYSTRRNNFEHGIHQSTVDKYADPVHFVYELLQNAEDQGASDVAFDLSSDRLTFEHNGQPFTRQDVENITGLGNSDKPQEANKIGRFGIGFKSVFAVTDAPLIYSTLEGEPFGFEIHDLVVPVPKTCQEDSLSEGKTRFILVFKPEKAGLLYKQISEKLQSLGADTLLFLHSIESIHWRTADAEGAYLCERSNTDSLCHLIGEKGEKGGEKQSEEIQYLMFSKEATLEDADRRLTVQIAFRMENEAIVPEPQPTVVNVYFPTEEKAGLKFRLHAPFLLTDNRANIKRDNSVNRQLIEKCGELLAESLPILRERGLLSVSLLNCLRHTLSVEFCPLSDAVKKALQTEALLPTDDGRHLYAKYAKIARSTPLRNLLTEQALTQLYSSDNLMGWLSADITETRYPELRLYLRDVIGVNELDPDGFASRITEAFLALQSDAWMIQFYEFLEGQPTLWLTSNSALRNKPKKPIIRLEDGNHVAPYAPNGNANAFLILHGDSKFPTVKWSIAQNENALAFLRNLGLSAPNVVDEVIESVLPRYSDKNYKPNNYADDIAKIERAWLAQKSNTDKEVNLIIAMVEAQFVLCNTPSNLTNTAFYYPRNSYFYTDENAAWFEGNDVDEIGLVSKEFSNLPHGKAIQAWLKQAILPNTKAPSKDGYVILNDGRGDYRRGLEGFDSDASIPSLDFAIRHINPERSFILWNILMKHTHLVKGVVESSSRKGYPNSKSKEEFSEIGKACTENSWLVDKNGDFHKPSEISLAELPYGFDTESNEAKKLSRLLGMRQNEVHDFAVSHNIDPEILENCARLSREDSEELKEWLANKRKSAFPEKVSPNPERRASKVEEDAKEATGKNYEIREISVRTSKREISEEARLYVRVQGCGSRNYAECGKEVFSASFNIF